MNNYSQVLLDRVNTIGKIDNNYSKYNAYMTPLSIYSLETLDDYKSLDLNNELLLSKIKFIIQGLSDSFSTIKHLITNKEFFNRVMEDDSNEYLSCFIKLIDVVDLNNYLSFSKKSMLYMFKKGYTNCSSYNRFLNIAIKYCISRNITSDSDVFRITNCFYNSAEKFNLYSSNFKFCYEFIDYQLKNNLDCLSYDEVYKNLRNNVSITDPEILNFLKFLCDNNIEIYSLKSILNNPNLNEKMELYKLISERFKKDDESRTIIKHLETKDFSLKEIKTFVYKMNTDEVKKLDKYFSKEELFNGLLDLIYPNYEKISKVFYDAKEMSSFIHYILKNNKKAFIKTLLSFEEDSFAIEYCYFDCPEVYEVLNLNILTKEQILKLSENIRHKDKLSSEYTENNLRNISFNEFNMLLKLSTQQKSLYLELIDLKPDERMRLIKDIPRDFETGMNFKELAYFLKEESLSSRIHSAYKTIIKVKSNSISKAQWLEYLTKSEIDFIRPFVKTESDVKFVLSHTEELKKRGACDFELAKKDIFFNSKVYKLFVERMKLSDSFLAKNSESLYNFYISGLMEVFIIYYNSIGYKHTDKLVNITKAEITDKLADIKFFGDDLKKEIDYEIDKKKEGLWENNVKNSSSKYTAEETFDYETIIKLGRIPVSTCMSYVSGIYNHCLLSNFDANKKVLLVKNSDDTIIARAILRLTKISNNSYNDDKHLSFRDIENLEKESVNNNANNSEELVLFLERCYTSDNNISSVHNELIKLAYKKAHTMNVRLILADEYHKQGVFMNSLDKDLKVQSKGYIYISKSKNGIQYLDSFGGSSTNDNSQYISCKGFTTLLQENMFNPDLDIKIETKTV